MAGNDWMTWFCLGKPSGVDNASKPEAATMLL